MQTNYNKIEFKVYKVGGAVRDKILGIASNDNDYVVVGATPTDLITLGYKQVGKDFPVFLHPKTHEEYALARTEKKTAPGYTGFCFNTSPQVTLEEDLKRRDITINAIAQDNYGNFIDPFNGINDIKNKIIRHVSDSFSEDPLRVLRVARFKSQFDFNIAKETLDLMCKICDSPRELTSLSKERIRLEVDKTLINGNLITFLEVLDSCKALEIVLTEFKTIIYNKPIRNNIEKLIKISKQQDSIPTEIQLITIYFFILYNNSPDNPQIVDNIIVNAILTTHSKGALKLLNNLYQPITNCKLLIKNHNASLILEIYNIFNPIKNSERYHKLVQILVLIGKITNNISKIDYFTKLIQKIATNFKTINYKQLLVNADSDKIRQIVYNKQIELITRIIKDY